MIAYSSRRMCARPTTRSLFSREPTPIALTIRDQLRQLALTGGERPALVFGDERLSYAELERYCLRFPTALDAATEAGLLPNGVQWLVAYLGTATSGRIFVGVNPWFTGTDLASMLGKRDPQLLVTTGRFRSHDFDAAPRAARGDGWVSGDRVASMAPPALRAIVSVGSTAAVTSTWQEYLASGNDGEPQHQAAPSDPALIVCTSGSQALLRNGEYIGGRQRITVDDPLLLSSPLFCANAVMVVLSHGSTLLHGYFEPQSGARCLKPETSDASTRLAASCRRGGWATSSDRRPERVSRREGTRPGEELPHRADLRRGHPRRDPQREYRGALQLADDSPTAHDVVEPARARLGSCKVQRVVELRPSGGFSLTSTGKVSPRDLATEIAVQRHEGRAPERGPPQRVSA